MSCKIEGSKFTFMQSALPLRPKIDMKVELGGDA
jgi:hypothetical protein